MKEQDVHLLVERFRSDPAGQGTPLCEAFVRLAEAYAQLSRRLEKISHISDRYQADLLDLNHRLQAANEELAGALQEVKTLHGFIPICARCKRVRDDQGYWEQVEKYISERSQAQFSHGLCPDCVRQFYPGISPELEGGPVQPRRSRAIPTGEEEPYLRKREEEVRGDPQLAGTALAEDFLDLVPRYLKMVRRLEKISRISDGFQAQLKVLNATLQEASRTDPLTGLANRRGAQESLLVEIKRAQRNGGGLVLVMADLDRFKRVNDTYGHAVGDLFLRHCAGLFRDNLRSYDVCARWGGEEFLLLLPEATLVEGVAVAEKLRARLEATPFRLGEDLLPVTASFGVARHQAGETAEDTVAAADRALYEAKRGGRNRVVAGK